MLSDNIITVEEYIRNEWMAERPSDFIDGDLFEIPGAKDINNKIAGKVLFILMMALKGTVHHVYAFDVKVKITGEHRYYYPEIFVTKEQETEENQYIKNEPVLIVEVVSIESQIKDYVDKYIDYTKIPSLQYYLIVEPETVLITCYARNEQGTWQTEKYTKLSDTVILPALNTSFTLQQIYQ